MVVHTTLRSWLEWLRCPCCGGGLQPEPLPAGSALACHRRRWPVVDGIVVLREGHATDRALEWLAQGDAQRAEAVLLGADLRSRGDRWQGHAERLLLRRPAGEGPATRRSLQRLRTGLDRSFDDAVETLFGQAPWPVPETAAYFRYRRSDPSFVAAEALAAQLARDRRALLDTGCGAGHLLASLQTAAPQARCLGLDCLYPALWLARAYVAPRAALICVDAGAPLPLRDDAVDGLISLDAFFDFPSLPGAACEFRRVLDPGGAALIAHLHNRLTAHRYTGRTPLAPLEYAEILAPLAPLSFWREDELLSCALGVRREPPRAVDPRELTDAPDVTVLGGAPLALKPLEPVPQPVGPVRLNPLYAQRPSGGGVTLLRGAHRYTSEREQGEHEALLPAEISAAADREPLLRARVLLPLPPGMHPRGTLAVPPAGAEPPARPRRGGPLRALRERRSDAASAALWAQLQRAFPAELPGAVAIVMGHRVTARRVADPYDLTLTTAGLDQLVSEVASRFRWIDLDAVGAPPPGLSFCLTFDDGTHDLFEHATPLLERHRVRAAVFVAGAEAAPAGRFWWDLKQGGGRRADPSLFLALPERYDVGHHGRRHLPFDRHPEDVEPLDHPCRPWFAFPFGVTGDLHATGRAVLEQAGFQLAVTTTPGLVVPGTDRLLLPRIALYDAPLAGLLERLLALAKRPGTSASAVSVQRSLAGTPRSISDR